MRLPRLRRRFADVVDRQLGIFAADHAARLEAIRTAYQRLERAERDDAEETFGDYQDEVDWAAEDLASLRDAYASTLEGDAELAYRRAFLRGVRRRFPPLAQALLHEDAEDDEDD